MVGNPDVSRRIVLRGAAVAALTAVAGPILIGNAAPASATQRLWKLCGRCRGLWFSGNNTRGGCPAGDILDGGHHDDGSGYDYILKEDPDGGQGQSGWRWCERCQGLWFQGINQVGVRSVCPSPQFSGLPDHVPFGSGFYRLEDVTHRDGPGGDDKWRWCRKCSGLFNVGDDAGGAGRCPADRQRHDIIGSGRYVLRISTSTRLPSPPY
ncbi:hypothetical protein [Nocardia goodfellowii]|uniref:Uncharacterized protein n=1 Tax=Nocardia goodfellowii TaxID=882446 RepID=A0ABS4QPK3_9NOCA|nr:hypothetical protein [Nocardia goodfellowii]MBP2193028.1 hypothetical protein [Nocardia goodfellowii]